MEALSPAARRVVTACLVAGVALRLMLFAVNPPTNAFDDHYRPISLMLETGELPAKDACWECYHPPAFYVSSALVAAGAAAAGLEPLTIQKIVHFLPCLYGICTLFALLGVLRRLGLSDFALCVALATACFLPRHVYMSAIHSNDTIAYLGVTVCVWLTLRALDGGLRPGALAWLAGAMAVTVVTKYTGLVVVPVVLATFGAAWLFRLAPGRGRIAAAGALVCVPALVTLTLFALPNVREYGRPFPSNLELFHDEWLASGRGARDVDFFGFHPLTTIATPILSPDNRDSLWTVLWARTFFDMEPRFLQFTDPVDAGWWDAYDRFLGGAEDEAWPGTAALGATTLLTGSTLISLGLLPLALLVAGLLRILFGAGRLLGPPDPARAARLQMFPVLIAGVMAGIVLTTVKFPYTFSMKSVYVMNALPAAVACVGLGAQLFDDRPWARRLVAGGTALLALVCTVHVLTLFTAMARA